MAAPAYQAARLARRHRSRFVVLASAGVAFVACGRTHHGDRLGNDRETDAGAGGRSGAGGGSQAGAGTGADIDSVGGGAAGTPSPSLGGAATAGAGGEGGTADEGLILGRVEHRYTGAGVPGIKVAINGVALVSDAQGMVYAEAPPGAYDAAVFDDTSGHAVTVYVGLSRRRPVFYVGRAEPLPNTASITGSLQGELPPDVPGRAVLFEANERIYSAMFNATDGSFEVRPEWQAEPTTLTGVLYALGWATDGAAFWHGKRAAKVTATSSVLEANIQLASLPVRSVKVHASGLPGFTFAGRFDLGRFVTVHGVVEGDSTQLVPTSPALAGAGYEPAFVAHCGGDGNHGVAELRAVVPNAAQEIALSCPPVPSLVAPEDGDVVSQQTRFYFTPIAERCHEVSAMLGSVSVTIVTLKGDAALPNFELPGLGWPIASQGSWSVADLGPCSGPDEYVTPELGREHAWNLKAFTTSRSFTLSP